MTQIKKHTRILIIIAAVLLMSAVAVVIALGLDRPDLQNETTVFINSTDETLLWQCENQKEFSDVKVTFMGTEGPSTVEFMIYVQTERSYPGRLHSSQSASRRFPILP